MLNLNILLQKQYIFAMRRYHMHGYQYSSILYIYYSIPSYKSFIEHCQLNQTCSESWQCRPLETSCCCDIRFGIHTIILWFPWKCSPFMLEFEPRSNDYIYLAIESTGLLENWLLSIHCSKLKYVNKNEISCCCGTIYLFIKCKRVISTR